MHNHHNTNPTTQRPESVNKNGNISQASYQDGYLEGRATERRFQKESYIAPEQNNGASAWLIGFALTAGIGFIVGVLFFLTQQPQPATRVVPVPAPNENSSRSNNNGQSQNSTNRTNRTTIIERTIDQTQEVVPVPEKTAPNSPDINFNPPTSSQPQGSNSQTSSAQPESQSQEQRNRF